MTQIPDQEANPFPVLPPNLHAEVANAILASMELKPDQARIVHDTAGMLVALALDDQEAGQPGQVGVRLTTLVAQFTPAAMRALTASLAGLAAQFASEVDPETRTAILTAHDTRKG